MNTHYVYLSLRRLLSLYDAPMFHQFYRAVRCNPTAQYYSRFSVLKPIVYRIADQEIGVAREASNILIPIGNLSSN